MLRVPGSIHCSTAMMSGTGLIAAWSLGFKCMAQLLTSVMLLQKAGYEVYAMQALELNPKVSKDKSCSAMAPRDVDIAKHAS